MGDYTYADLGDFCFDSIPLGQHAVLTLPDTGGASPCREVGLALRANLACLSIPLPVPPPPLPLKPYSVLCNL